jgi:uncharacterized membrane protein YeaQ/YmgE (transglycosylase-associated protein family)
VLRKFETEEMGRGLEPTPAFLLRRVNGSIRSCSARPEQGSSPSASARVCLQHPGQQGSEQEGEGLLRDIILGVIGGDRWRYHISGCRRRGVTGLNLWSILVAFVGGVVVLLVYHTV